MHQNLEYNICKCNTKNISQFSLKNSKISGFRLYLFKKLVFGGIFNKDYTFYTKNLFFYNERCPKFCKNQFFSNIFRFLSIIRQNFDYNLRILANFGVKNPKSTDFAHTF